MTEFDSNSYRGTAAKLQRIASLVRKETRQIVRDPSSSRSGSCSRSC